MRIGNKAAANPGKNEEALRSEAVEEFLIKYQKSVLTIFYSHFISTCIKKSVIIIQWRKNEYALLTVEKPCLKLF